MSVQSSDDSTENQPPLALLPKWLLSYPLIGCLYLMSLTYLWEKLTDTLLTNYLAGIAFCAATGLLVFKTCKGRSAKFRNIAASVTVTLLLISNHFIAVNSNKQSDKPQFAVVLKTGLQSQYPQGSQLFWLVQNVTNTEIASPVNLMFYVEFKNLRHTPIRIEHYHVRLEVSNGWWAVLRTVDLRAGDLFFVSGGEDFKNAKEVDIRRDDFNTRISQRDIQPNETVEGWIGLETSHGTRGHRGTFHIAEAVSNLERYEFFLKPPTASGESLQVNQATLRFKGNRDISKIPKAAFSMIPSSARYYKPN